MGAGNFLKQRWWIAVAGIAIAGAFPLTMWLREEPPVPIAVTSPTLGDIRESASTNGTVVPVNDFLARANNPGTVEKVLVHLGDTVKPGQLLVKMHDPYAQSRVASAEAALQSTQVGADNMRQGGSQEDRIFIATDRQRAQLELASAQKYLATVKTLLATGGASPAEVRAADQREENARVSLQNIEQRIAGRYSTRDVASWKTRLEQAQENLQAERANLAGVDIISPIAGTVYLVPASQYDYVGPGAELIHVADLTHLQVRADFDEPDIPKIRDGESAEITWEGKPGRTWTGHVEHAPIGATRIGIRSVGQSIIAVDNKQQDLAPNVQVGVTVQTGARKHVLTLPREALYTQGDARYVLSVRDNRLVRTPVTPGLVTLDKAEIISGVGPADLIALHAMNNRALAPGMRVTALR